jgi:hypothetical protein
MDLNLAGRRRRRTMVAVCASGIAMLVVIGLMVVLPHTGHFASIAH